MTEPYRYRYSVVLIYGDNEIWHGVVKGVTKQEALGEAMCSLSCADSVHRWSVKAVDNQPTDIAIRYLKEGRKIEAIKEVRQETGWGLKEAKSFVDDIMMKNRHLFPHFYPDFYTRSC